MEGPALDFFKCPRNQQLALQLVAPGNEGVVLLYIGAGHGNTYKNTKKGIYMRVIAALLLVLAIAAPVHAEDKRNTTAPKIGWAIALGSVAVYEIWAIKTKHETFSQSVQRSKAMKIAVGVGLGALTIHLYVK